MRRCLPIAISTILLLGACATTSSPERQLTTREQEALLLREVDRSRKHEEATIERLSARARKGGPAFLAAEEENARKRSVALYRSLIEKYPDNRNNIMAEASFRLAELLFESERERIRKIIDTRGFEGELTPDFSEAIEAYSAVVNRFPDHPLVEDALYGLAYCYTEQGYTDLAADGYYRLIELYPGTRYALEINMRLGEYYFENNDLERAKSHYRAVIDTRDPEYLDKAYYKLGWCLYNQERYSDAIDSFFALLDLDITRVRDPDSLVGESIEIIARSFAESSGTPGLTRRLASRTWDSRSSTLLLNLADLYKERSLYPEAVGTYRTYIKHYPAGKELPEVLAHLGESYHTRGDPLSALELSERSPDLLGPESPYYSKLSEEEKQKTRSLILESLEESADRRRARALAGGSESDLHRARINIDIYFRFAGDEVPCRVRFLLGTVQSELRSYPDTVVTLNGLSAREECSQWAERSSLMAIDFQVEIYEEKKEVDIAMFTASVDHLADAAPENPGMSKAVLALGEIATNLSMYPDARSHFSRVIRHHSATAESARARVMMARTFFHEGNYRQAAAWFKEAWRKSPKTEDGLEAKRLHIYSLFKEAGKLSKQNQVTAAAGKFENIYRSFPDVDVAQTSLYNAGKLYRQLGLEMKATDLFEELAAAHEESKLARDALKMSVLILEALGDPGRAAEDAHVLADRTAGEERARSLIKSADLFSTAGLHEKAANIREIFTREYPDPAQRMVKQTFRMGTDLETAGKWDHAAAVYRKVIANYSSEPGSTAISGFAARAQLRLAEKAYRRYVDIKIVPPVERTVERKRKLLQSVIKHFVDAGSYRIADVITASNYYIGRSLELFKDEILGSPNPPGLSGPEAEEYRMLLQEMAYPFEEKALSAYRVNITRSQKLQLLDPWIEKSFARMALLAPWAYGRDEHLSYPLTLTSLEPLQIPPSPDSQSIAAALDSIKSDGGKK